MKSPRVLFASVIALVAAVLLALWLVDPFSNALRGELGVAGVSASPLPSAVTVDISAARPIFTPPAATVIDGGTVTFRDDLRDPIEVRTTRLSPASFSLALRPGQARSVNLTRVGLYHYFDAAVDRATRIDDGNQIVVSPRKAPVRQGWIAVIPRAPGLHGSFVVPNGEDLFTPKMIVTIVGSAIVITNHDTDAHNFVVDPHSPTGGAFIIYGQDAEPPSGWQRLFVAQQPGLYHLYCTLHTKPIGKVGGWTLVAPRSPKASGFKDHNPMEAWVVVLPAETQ